MEQETINKITKIAKDQQQTLSEETGVESSIDDSEIKQYLNEVIKEVQRHKQKNINRPFQIYKLVSLPYLLQHSLMPHTGALYHFVLIPSN